MTPGLFSMSYLGPIDYWAALLRYPQASWEAWETYPKQSYRNRCYIDSPNGPLKLTVPVNHRGARYSGRIELSPQRTWMRTHLQALQTTYGHSPFYETIGPGLAEVLSQPPATLWELNHRLAKRILHWLRQDQRLSATSSWVTMPERTDDLRDLFHPKRVSPVKTFPPYWQNFRHKHGFIPNLSIIDLLMNEGPAAGAYLQQLEFVFSPV